MTAVVVTGASGFLGQHIVRNLVAQGLDVTAVSRSAVTFPSQVKHVQTQDYLDTPAPEGSVLVHLAENNVILEEGNDTNAHKVMKSFLDKPYAQIVYASSASVYGDQNQAPNTPDRAPHPMNAYARAKLACERLTLESNGTVLRLANVFGPGMSTNNVLSDIIGQLDQSGPLAIRDLSPVRDFIWVEDVAEAVCAVIKTKATGILNVGTGLGYSIRQLAELVLSIEGQEDRDIIAAQRPSRSSHIVLDIAETTEKTGWAPKVSLAAGLKRLLL